MTERCPACKQIIRQPGIRVPARYCYDCGNPIERHHKYTFQDRDGATVLVHRVCCVPDGYFRAAVAKREKVVGYRHLTREQIEAATARENELEEGFRLWRIANGHAREDDFK